MRVQSIIAATTILFIATATTIDAQTTAATATAPASVSSPSPSTSPIPTAPDMPNEACNECLRNNIKSISNCATYTAVPVSNATDPGARKCFCALASSYTWLTSCQTDSACTAAYVNFSEQAYDNTKGAVCSGVDAKGSSAAAMLVPKAGAVLAMVALAAQVMFQ